MAQQPLARAQRQRRRVVPREVQHVEDVEEDPDRVVAALLQAREARLRARERDHLAVEDDVADGVGLQRRGDLGEAAVEAEVVARSQPHDPSALNARQRMPSNLRS